MTLDRLGAEELVEGRHVERDHSTLKANAVLGLFIFPFGPNWFCFAFTTL